MPNGDKVSQIEDTGLDSASAISAYHCYGDVYF